VNNCAATAISFAASQHTQPTAQPASGCQQNDSINACCRQFRQISRICAAALLMLLPGGSIEGERRLDFRQLPPRRLLRFDLLHGQISR